MDVARAVTACPYPGRVAYARTRAHLLTAFDENAALALLCRRRDGLETLRRLLWALANRVDWHVQGTRRQMLVSVPHRVLAEQLGRSLRTVRRALRTLEAAGHIATVREGSTDEFRPAWAAEGNTVPVYVLLVPADDVEEHRAQDVAPEPAPTGDPADGSGSRPRTRGSAVDGLRRLSLVDIDVLPSPTPVGSRGNSPYTHARASAHDPAAPLRGTHPNNAAARRGPGTGPGTRVDPPRQDIRWPRYTPARTRNEMLHAAEQLRHDVFPLRQISTRDVRSIIREFLLAGWTVADVAYAVDHRPDGTPHPHSGAGTAVTLRDGTTRDVGVVTGIRGWLTYRLRHWRDDAGTVRRSHGQRQDADRARSRARTRALREQHAQWEASRSATPSAGAAAVRAALAAARARTAEVDPAARTRFAHDAARAIARKSHTVGSDSDAQDE